MGLLGGLGYVTLCRQRKPHPLELRSGCGFIMGKYETVPTL